MKTVGWCIAADCDGRTAYWREGELGQPNTWMALDIAKDALAELKQRIERESNWTNARLVKVTIHIEESARKESQ